MNRGLRLLPLATAVLALSAAPAMAGGIPDCSLSTIPNVVASPTGLLGTTFTIVSSSGPISGATVELRYSAAGNSGACWCTGQVHPIISGTTNASGQVTFHVSGGGCLNPAVLGGSAVQVYVNSIPCKEIGQVSPDVVATTAPPCTVSLTDAVNFTNPLATGTYGYCYDLNSDLVVGLTDAVVFTLPAATSVSCP